MKKKFSSEDKVKSTVRNYLKKSFTDGFYTRTEKQIQIGSGTGRADIVLLPMFDGDSSIVAIVECKGVKRDKDTGIKQLKAYLSATDTRLGIFANSMNVDEWHYIENVGRSCFKPITRAIFEKSVKEENWWQRSVKSRIQKRSEMLIEQEAKKRFAASGDVINRRTEYYIEFEARKRVNEKRISTRAEKILYKELEKTQAELEKTQTQLQVGHERASGQLQVASKKLEKRLWSAFWGWALFIMAIILLFFFKTP